ncbi:hypothetical protein, partial [Vibrio cholerae]|uniref:hypothetical protein n=1 Tax=Vibrio cholerae TaxID=666 RepID=UPI0030807856
QERADLVEGIHALCQETLANSELTERIRHKYRLKNTTGYALKRGKVLVGIGANHPWLQANFQALVLHFMSAPIVG